MMLHLLDVASDVPLWVSPHLAMASTVVAERLAGSPALSTAARTLQTAAVAVVLCVWRAGRLCFLGLSL